MKSANNPPHKHKKRKVSLITKASHVTGEKRNTFPPLVNDNVVSQATSTLNSSLLFAWWLLLSLNNQTLKSSSSGNTRGLLKTQKQISVYVSVMQDNATTNMHTPVVWRAEEPRFKTLNAIYFKPFVWWMIKKKRWDKNVSFFCFLLINIWLVRIARWVKDGPTVNSSIQW